MSNYVKKFLPYIIKAFKEYYFVESTDFFESFTTLKEFKDHIDANMIIESKLLKLVDPNSYLDCMYEYLSLNHTATYPDLISWYRQYYHKTPADTFDEIKLMSTGYARNQFKDHITIMKLFGIIKEEIVFGNKGSQYLFITPFCSKEKFDKAMYPFSKFEEHREFMQKQFYDREKKDKKPVKDPVELVTCGAFSVNCTVQIPVSQKYCAAHIKVFA